jgi:hypothetical protein
MKETLFVRLFNDSWIKLVGTEDELDEALDSSMGYGGLICGWSRDDSPIRLNYPGVNPNELPIFEFDHFSEKFEKVN